MPYTVKPLGCDPKACLKISVVPPPGIEPGRLVGSGF
jgi:hypothetical protein